ncbi:sensor histidine kinase [Enterococcus sp. DIV0086]|uniref:sensor histidine kinase n=1 Tax=Enterococcus sp. DIV0086 TaxID=2774655 RepID=UPI003D2E2448
MSEQLLSEFKPLLRKGQFFIADIENDVMINTDLTIIERILDNVIKNSINYGLLNSEIQFRLKNNKSKINLKIINSCNPLTTEQVKSVFEPFYRIDKARGTYNGGTGLGLYITKNFVEKIGGKITFNYQHHKATIDIIFPLI